MQAKIIEKPIISNKKVYIINDAQKMTKEAQNCLLKTLEEPPEFITIILICANESMLLNTIKSRCTKITFQPIENDELRKYLENNNFNNITDNMLKTINGSISKAYEIQNFMELYQQVEYAFSKVDKIDEVDFINQMLPIYKEKENIIGILEYINVILFEKGLKEQKYLNCIEIVEQSKNRLKQNVNLDMTLDNMLFKIWENCN